MFEFILISILVLLFLYLTLGVLTVKYIGYIEITNTKNRFLKTFFIKSFLHFFTNYSFFEPKFSEFNKNFSFLVLLSEIENPKLRKQFISKFVNKYSYRLKLLPLFQFLKEFLIKGFHEEFISILYVIFKNNLFETEKVKKAYLKLICSDFQYCLEHVDLDIKVYEFLYQDYLFSEILETFDKNIYNKLCDKVEHLLLKEKFDNF